MNARIHSAEMVVPAKHAEAVRAAADQAPRTPIVLASISGAPDCRAVAAVMLIATLSAAVLIVSLCFALGGSP